MDKTICNDSRKQQFDQVCKELRIERIRKGLTQTEIAKKLGISAAEYNKIEKGQRKKVKKEYLRKLSAILQIDYQYLLSKFELSFEQDDSKYYDTNGKSINIEMLSEKIYSIDPDILSMFLSTIETKDNITIIKKVLLILSTGNINKEKRELLYNLLKLFENS